MDKIYNESSIECTDEFIKYLKLGIVNVYMDKINKYLDSIIEENLSCAEYIKNTIRPDKENSEIKIPTNRSIHEIDKYNILEDLFIKSFDKEIEIRRWRISEAIKLCKNGDADLTDKADRIYKYITNTGK